MFAKVCYLHTNLEKKKKKVFFGPFGVWIPVTFKLFVVKMTDFSLFRWACKWRRGDKSSAANRLFGLLYPSQRNDPAWSAHTLPPSITASQELIRGQRGSVFLRIFHAGSQTSSRFGGEWRGEPICTHWFGRWLGFRGPHVQVGHHGLKTLAFFRKLLGEKESTLVEITAAERKGFQVRVRSDQTNDVIDGEI